MDSGAEEKRAGHLGAECRENEKGEAGRKIESAGDGSAFEAIVPKMHSLFLFEVTRLTYCVYCVVGLHWFQRRGTVGLTEEIWQNG